MYAAGFVEIRPRTAGGSTPTRPATFNHPMHAWRPGQQFPSSSASPLASLLAVALALVGLVIGAVLLVILLPVAVIALLALGVRARWRLRAAARAAHERAADEHAVGRANVRVRPAQGPDE